MYDEKTTSQQAEPAAEGGPQEAGFLGSLWAEGERLVQQTAGQAGKLAQLITSLPGELKEAAIEASHRLFGHAATAEATVGAAEAQQQPAQQQEQHAEAAPDALHQVMAHAGERVSDGGGYEYVVGADGSFEIVKGPSAVGRKIEPTGKYAKAWQTIAAKLGVTATPAAAPQQTAPAQQQEHHEAKPVVGGNTTAAAGGEMGADASSGVADVKVNAPTIEGDTLAIAKTRAELGEDHTKYLRKFATKEEEQQFAKDLASGATTQDTFYCSGLSIWTLAAAGYEMSTKMKGADGVEVYGEIHTEIDVDAKGKKTTDPTKAVGKKTVVTKKYVTFKQLLDGEPQSVEIMTKANKQGHGGSVGVIDGTGYATDDGVEDGVVPLAGRGAAGAFEAAHVGAEVAEVDQKPGDFAQSRRTTKGAKDEGTEEERGHFGFGHAWQVYSVRVRGAAMFGQKGSPKTEDAGASGWKEDVEYVIDADTDPALVGAHTVLSATRLEANIGGAMEDKETDGGGAKDKKGRFIAGDGGVQITGEKKVPDAGLSSYSDYVVFYGRLSASRWASWTPAQRPAD